MFKQKNKYKEYMYKQLNRYKEYLYKQQNRIKNTCINSRIDIKNKPIQMLSIPLMDQVSYDKNRKTHSLFSKQLHSTDPYISKYGLIHSTSNKNIYLKQNRGKYPFLKYRTDCCKLYTLAGKTGRYLTPNESIPSTFYLHCVSSYYVNSFLTFKGNGKKLKNM